MKKILTACISLVICMTAFAQNDRHTTEKTNKAENTTAQPDTLSQAQPDSVTFFERVGEDLKEGGQAIGDGAKKGYNTVKGGVVKGYEATEEAVVKGYKATEGAVVKGYEATEEAVVKGHGAVSGWFKKVFGKQPRKEKNDKGEKAGQ